MKRPPYLSLVKFAKLSCSLGRERDDAPIVRRCLMSEQTLSSVTFPQAILVAEPQPAGRFSIAMAVLTIVLASSLLWIGIYAVIRFIFGL